MCIRDRTPSTSKAAAAAMLARTSPEKMCIRDSPLVLPCEVDHRPVLLDGRRQLGPGIPLVGDPVSYTHLDVYKRQPGKGTAGQRPDMGQHGVD